MPKPEPKESLSKYMARYMGSKESRKSFPKRKQRAAVAYSEYRQAHHGKE